MRLIAQKLTAAAFAPFGSVSRLPADGGVEFGPAANLRPGAATPRLNWVMADPVTLPATLTVMERHRFSSQSFLPAEPDALWLVVVAPHDAAGRPDLAGARAFAAGGDQGITYAPDVWHHPLTALHRPARMALLTFRDGGPDDDEFVTLAAPLLVANA